jgi:hypothetical protein
VRVLAALLAGGLVVGLAWVGAASHAPTPTDVAAATARAHRLAAQPEHSRADCLAAQQQARRLDPTADLSCDEVKAPTTRDALVDHRYAFAERINGAVVALSLLSAVAAFLVGASIISAARPADRVVRARRFDAHSARGAAAEAAALATGVAGFVGALLVVGIGGLALVAATRGTLQGTTGGLVVSTVLTALRGVGLAGGAALMGLALAGILRRTAAAVAVAVGYLVVGEPLLRHLWARAPVWLASTRVVAWLQGGYDVPVVSGCATAVGDAGQCRLVGITVPVSTAEAAGYLGLLVAGALTAFVVVSAHRDARAAVTRRAGTGPAQPVRRDA